MSFIKGASKAAEGVGRGINAAGTVIENVAHSETTNNLFKFAGETVLDVLEETKYVVKLIWQWIKRSVEAIINAVVRVVKATLEIVTNWFKTIQINKEDETAFTLTEELKNGRYQVIQGIFSKTKNNVTSHVTLKADEIEQELKSEEIIIYN